MSDHKHIAAIITLAEKELAKGEWTHRAGVLSALLHESLPFLREYAADLKAKADRLAVLPRELEIAESNASERSCPASTLENEAEILRLRVLIAEAQA